MSTSPDPRTPGYDQPTVSDRAYDRQMYNDAARSGQSQREDYVDPMGNRVEQRVDVYEDKNQSRANARYWITRVTYFVLGVLEVILGLRLLFRLLGANQDNGFITLLYSLSHIFVVGFNGIFNDQALGRSVFEVSTLIAMLVYALIAWGIVSLGRVLFAPILADRQNITTTRRDRGL